jgi:hypothetical protein
MVMRVRWLVVMVIAIACHNTPPPEEPVPVSSTGTPIGFLIDDTQLHLSSQQLGDLRGIDAILLTQLQQVDKADKKLGSAAPPVQQPVQPIGRRRHGFNQGQGGGSATRRSGPNAASADKLADERMELVKSAVARVLTVLDKSQQERAKEVLSDHDIDLDFDELAHLPPPQQPSNDNQPSSPRPRFGRPAANDGETASETTVMPHDNDAAVEVGPAPAAIPAPTQGTAKPPPAIPPPAPPPTQAKAPPKPPAQKTPPTIPPPAQSAAPPPTIPPPSQASSSK